MTKTSSGEGTCGRSASSSVTAIIQRGQSWIPHMPPSLSVRSGRDRKSTRLNSSHVASSYAVFCLKKKTSHFRPRRRADQKDRVDRKVNSRHGQLFAS